MLAASPPSPCRATNRSGFVTLARLPHPCAVSLGDFFPWSPVTTSDVVALLSFDRGLWATWRNRGIGPQPLPREWFRRSAGNPTIFLISTVLGWLAARHGEAFDERAFWHDWLETAFGEGHGSGDWPIFLATSRGPSPSPGIRFTAAGFQAYLKSLEG